MTLWESKIRNEFKDSTWRIWITNSMVPCKFHSCTWSIEKIWPFMKCEGKTKNEWTTKDQKNRIFERNKERLIRLRFITTYNHYLLFKLCENQEVALTFHELQQLQSIASVTSLVASIAIHQLAAPLKSRSASPMNSILGLHHCSPQWHRHGCWQQQNTLLHYDWNKSKRLSAGNCWSPMEEIYISVGSQTHLRDFMFVGTFPVKIFWFKISQ